MSRKKSILLLSLILLLISNSKVLASDDKLSSSDRIVNPDKKELKVGEDLLYRVELFGVPIGWISLNVKEKIIFEGHSCYHLTAQAYTNHFFKKVYDVEYNVDAYIDTDTLLPYRFQKKRRLKKEFTETKIDFDWIKKQAIISSNISNQQMVNLDENRYQDLLSSIYYFRLMDIESGKIYNLKIFYGQNPWQINIKVKSLQEMEIYRRGVFNVFETEIDTELSKIILGNPKITVHFLNNLSRIPITFFVRIPFGHLKGKVYNLIN